MTSLISINKQLGKSGYAKKETNIISELLLKACAIFKGDIPVILIDKRNLSNDCMNKSNKVSSCNST